jgi:hypothetical protein
MRRTARLSPVLLPFLWAGAVDTLAGTYSQEVRTGLGYDSNAFLSHDSSFFDPFSDAVLTPVKDSGFFVPLDVKAEYVIASGRTTLTPAFDFRYDKYLKRSLDNADSYWVDLGAAGEFLLRKTRGYRDTLTITPSVAYNKETYVDRENGLEKIADTTQETLANRFSYSRYGLDAELRVRTTPVRFALEGRVRMYDYQEALALDSLDYDYRFIGLELERDISQTTKVEVRLEHFVRDFVERRARDLEGALVDGSDRKYTYDGTGVTLRQKLGEGWTAYLDYDRLERNDEFVGYFDYIQHRYRIRARYRDGRGRRVRLELAFWGRDYPRAFAFENPDFPRKRNKTWEAGIQAERPLSGRWKLWTEYEFKSQNSTDPRYDYDRHVLSAGVGMEL